MRRNESHNFLAQFRSKNSTRVFVILCLVILPVFLFPSTMTHATSVIMYNDPLGSFQGTGQTPVFWAGQTPLFWPGNEKINNTSFENGILQPWTISSYNANKSSASIISPGLNDNYAVQLSITSGNLTSSSYERLSQDLSLAQATFSNNTVLQASAQVTALTGTSAMDRAGVIVSLASSTGTTVRLHYVFDSGAGLPANTTSDAYFKVAGFGSTGWINMTRSLASDTRSVFPSLASSIDAVKSVSLYVDSMSLGSPNRDPRIKFYDHFATGTWNSSDTVIYDSDQDGTYQSGDPILYTGTYSPTIGSSVINDPLIKFVDLNQSGVWGLGKPVVYDCGNTIPGDCGNNVVDIDEPVIYGNPIIGQLLMDPIRRVTTASFDQIQLFSSTAGGNLIINGGFETGSLAGWGNSAGFSISNVAHTGSYSALGTVTGGSIQLAQSLDSQPTINSLTVFQASVNTTTLSGTSSSDMVDVWLGLSDARGAPLSVYYVFDVGNGILPTNTTGTIYYEAPGWGILKQWLSISRTLSQDTSVFNAQGFSSPYSVNLVALELRSGISSTSSANFDDVSLSSGLGEFVPSTFYALDGQNTTYTYTVSNVPTGFFSLQIAAGQSIVNITTPNSTILQPSDYNITNTPPTSLINIPNSTGTRYPIGGTYRFYTTSKNAVGTVYIQDASTLSVLNLTRPLNPGQRISLTELSFDPFGTGIAGASSTISIWTSNGTMIKSWNGAADNSGFYRVLNIAAPLSNGNYTLQATSYSNTNVGIRTRHFSVLVVPTPAPSYILTIILVLVAVIAASAAAFMIFKRKRKTMPSAPKQPPPTKTTPGKKS